MFKVRAFSVSLIILFMLSIILSVSVSAQTRLEDRQQALDERIGNAKNERCERVANRVRSHVDRYKSNRDKHVQRYTEIKENSARAIEKLNQKGYDTSEVANDLEKLEQMITNFRNNNEEAFVALIQSGEMACAEDREQFNSNIELAKQFLTQVRGNAKEIKEFIQTTLKVDLQELRAEIKSESN